MQVKINIEDDYTYIRRQVFMIEQGFKNEFDEIDAYATHVTIYQDEDVIGCGRVYPDREKGIFRLGRIAVLKPYRKKGYGSIIVKALEKEALHQGAIGFVLDAQQRASDFYKEMGYSEYGDIHMDEHVPHIQMKKYVQQDK